jgi:hypothetical protein
MSFKFESFDLYIVILWLLKLFCGLRATGTSLNITYKDSKKFGLGILRLIRILNFLEACTCLRNVFR